MQEYQYQVFSRYGDGVFILRASNMALCDAMLFVKTMFKEFYNEDSLRFEIRRQPWKEGEKSDSN